MVRCPPTSKAQAQAPRAKPASSAEQQAGGAQLKWCDDCAWPEQCSAEMDCRRRSAGEVRAAALPEDAARIIAALSEADPETPAGAVLLVAARAPALTVAVTRAPRRIGGRA